MYREDFITLYISFNIYNNNVKFCDILYLYIQYTYECK